MIADLAGAIQWLGDEFKSLIGWAVNNVISWIQVAFQVLRTFGDTEISSVVSSLHAAFPSATTALASSYIPKINTVFPLSETMTFATAYGTIWATVVVYRLVKSWIPTVAT